MVRNLTQPAASRRPEARPLVVTVFCGAALAAEYLKPAADIGRLLAEHHLQVVYGGGRLGLMGALADAVLDAGGHITGILPAFLDAVPGVAHRGLTELRIVPDLAARKAELTDRADAFLALPGGLGTLDELAHVWAAAAFAARPRPVGLLNVGGIYTPLIDYVRRSAGEGFLAHHAHLCLEDLLLADSDPACILAALIERVRPAAMGYSPGASAAPLPAEAT